MGMRCEWEKVSKLRKIIKDMKTKAQKSRNGNIVGGVILNEETAKPYAKQLAELEAKLAKDKEQMPTGERMDTVGQEVMANDDQNTEAVIAVVKAGFKKAYPKKFKDSDIDTWAYIDAKGSADYYKTSYGDAHPRKDDIPVNCVFVHKVFVVTCIDKDLDLYKFFHEDGKAGHATGLAPFTFITQVGRKIFLTKIGSTSKP